MQFKQLIIYTIEQYAQHLNLAPPTALQAIQLVNILSALASP